MKVLKGKGVKIRRRNEEFFPGLEEWEILEKDRENLHNLS